MSTSNNFNEIWEILWEDPSTFDPKTALKAEAFRKVFVAAFKKELKPERLPPGIEQKKVADVRARAWKAFQKPDKFIIIMLFGPLEKPVSSGGDKEIMSSEAAGKSYKKENKSSLTVYRGDDSWRISFRTVLPELAGRKIPLVIIDKSTGQEVFNEIQELEEDEDEEIWEFNISLPTSLDLRQQYEIQIKPPK